MSERTDAVRVAAATGRPSALRMATADWRRMRGTWILPLAVLGPLGVTLMGFILFALERDHLIKPFLAGTKSGFTVATEQLGMVHVFSVGLGAALLASMIVDVDHRSDTWKSMFALPVSRPLTYAVKYMWCAALLAVSSAVMVLGYAAIMLWQHLGPVPWYQLARLSALVWVASLPLLGLQLLLSGALRNQALPLTVGILAPVFGMGMAQIPPWTPWRLMTQALVYATGGVAAGTPDAALTWYGPATICAVSAGLAVTLVATGMVHFSTREFR